MSSITWFRLDDMQAIAIGRDAHLFLHGQGVYGGAAIVRARDMGSTSAAEAELQRWLASMHERGLGPVSSRWQLQWCWATLPLLAHELAQVSHGASAWRRYADWAWRVGDPRGELVELHESLEQAGHPRQRAALQERLDAHEARHFGCWRARLIADHARRNGDAGRLEFVRGHLSSVIGWPTADLNPRRQPLAIAKLELSLDDPEALGRLYSVLAMPAFAGLRRLRLRLDQALTAGDAAALLAEIRRRLGWLRELEIVGRPGAALCVDGKAVAALGRLLRRHEQPVCGLGLERLRLDLDLDPAGGWSIDLVDELLGALKPSMLRSLELRASTMPAALRTWTESLGFASRLGTLRSDEEGPRQTSRASGSLRASGKAGPPPPQLGERGPALLVWADWLQTLGEPLGELAIETAELDDHDPAFLPKRAAIEAELLACAEAGAGLELDWRGPLIEHATVRRSERLLERLLGSPAAARLRSLRLEGESFARVSLVRPGLEELELDQRQALELAPILDVMPDLTRLCCRAPQLRLGGHRPHTALRELRLMIPGDLDQRSSGRLFAQIHAAAFPKLAVLNLELAPRHRGAPLSFAGLEPPLGVEVRVHGSLREQDGDALLRQAITWRGGRLVIVDRQPPATERRMRSRISNGRFRIRLWLAALNSAVPLLERVTPWAS